jgi:hypothetical protein
VVREDEMSCCVECFDEPEIKEFIEALEEVGDCDYCDSKGIYIAETSEVADFILEGVERVYEDAVEHVGFDSSEGGYQLTTTSIADILEGWGIFSERLDDPTDLLRDFNFDDVPYVRQDPYGPVSGGEEAITNWEEFCERVKRHQRFTILVPPPSESDLMPGDEPPSAFVAEMARWMNQELVNVVVPGVTIYRARIVRGVEQFGNADLTSPPSSAACNNRMSPAGISFFYGALDIDTAIAEVRPSVGDRIAVASFEVCRNLGVLDFSIIPEPTSPFSDSFAFRFEEFILPFLEHFAEEISKPIRVDDALINYVPTQVFTEYLRFSTDGDGPLDGLVYGSSMRNGGKCVVLFKGPEISSENDCQESDSWLRYKGHSVYEITGVEFQHTQVDKE